MRGGLDGVQVERRLRHRLDRGEQHREVLRPAARHDGIDGELLDRGLPLPRRQDGDHLAPVAVVCRRNSATRPSVGGTIGSPSVQPRST